MLERLGAARAGAMASSKVVAREANRMITGNYKSFGGGRMSTGTDSVKE